MAGVVVGLIVMLMCMALLPWSVRRAQKDREQSLVLHPVSKTEWRDSWPPPAPATLAVYDSAQDSDDGWPKDQVVVDEPVVMSLDLIAIPRRPRQPKATPYVDLGRQACRLCGKRPCVAQMQLDGWHAICEECQDWMLNSPLGWRFDETCADVQISNHPGFMMDRNASQPPAPSDDT